MQESINTSFYEVKIQNKYSSMTSNDNIYFYLSTFIFFIHYFLMYYNCARAHTHKYGGYLKTERYFYIFDCETLFVKILSCARSISSRKLLFRRDIHGTKLPSFFLFMRSAVTRSQVEK